MSGSEVEDMETITREVNVSSDPVDDVFANKAKALLVGREKFPILDFMTSSNPRACSDTQSDTA